MIQARNNTFPVTLSISLGKQDGLFYYTLSCLTSCPVGEQAELMKEFLRANHLQYSKDFIEARLAHLLKEPGVRTRETLLPAVLELLKELNVRVV